MVFYLTRWLNPPTKYVTISNLPLRRGSSGPLPRRSKRGSSVLSLRSINSSYSNPKNIHAVICTPLCNILCFGSTRSFNGGRTSRVYASENTRVPIIFTTVNFIYQISKRRDIFAVAAFIYRWFSPQAADLPHCCASSWRFARRRALSTIICFSIEA